MPVQTETIEEIRERRHAAAITTMQEVAAARVQLAKLTQEADKLESAKETAAAQCDSEASPLRADLARLEDDTALLNKAAQQKQRDELIRKITKASESFWTIANELDLKLSPLLEQRRQLYAILAKANQARSDLLTYAPLDIAARLYTAKCAIHWGNGRLDSAKQKHGEAATLLTAAEVAAAQEALTAAKADELTARREALSMGEKS